MREGQDTRTNHGVYQHTISALGRNVARLEAEGTVGGVRLWQAQAPGGGKLYLVTRAYQNLDGFVSCWGCGRALIRVGVLTGPAGEGIVLEARKVT